VKLSDLHDEDNARFKLFNNNTTYTTIRCLKEEDLRSVWLIDIPDRGLTTLKRWPLTWNLRWKSLFNQSQPQCQLTGAWKLLTAGVNTPQPVTPVYRSDHYLQLEMPYIAGSTAFDLLNSHSNYTPSEQYLIAKELGKIVHRLASSHLRHRDFKLENVVIKPACDSQQQPTLWLIDPVGVRFCNSPLYAIVYMLDRLAIQPIHEQIPVPLSLQFICIRSALGSTSGKSRKKFFRMLRKQLGRSTWPAYSK
jgi:serine/threonine protein kinase